MSRRILRCRSTSSRCWTSLRSASCSNCARTSTCLRTSSDASSSPARTIAAARSNDTTSSRISRHSSNHSGQRSRPNRSALADARRSRTYVSDSIRRKDERTGSPAASRPSLSDAIARMSRSGVDRHVNRRCVVFPKSRSVCARWSLIARYSLAASAPLLLATSTTKANSSASTTMSGRPGLPSRVTEAPRFERASCRRSAIAFSSAKGGRLTRRLAFGTSSPSPGRSTPIPNEI